MPQVTFLKSKSLNLCLNLQTFYITQELCIKLCNVLGYDGVKLLGVPALPHKSSELAGNLIGEATTGLLKLWDCANQSRYMVFDTTSSNTGKVLDLKTLSTLLGKI